MQANTQTNKEQITGNKAMTIEIHVVFAGFIAYAIYVNTGVKTVTKNAATIPSHEDMSDSQPHFFLLTNTSIYPAMLLSPFHHS